MEFNGIILEKLCGIDVYKCVILNDDIFLKLCSYDDQTTTVLCEFKK